MDAPLNYRELKYSIFPPRFCAEPQLPLLERVYQFWFEGWSKVYKELGSGEILNPNDFFRQDFITSVTHGDQVVAIHLYSLYDFRTHLISRIPYVSAHFDERFIRRCQELGYKKMMSMEGLLANPAYRKRVRGIGFTELMAALGQRVFQTYTDADCIFTPTRVDNKTSQSAQKIGLRPLMAGAVAHCVPIDFLVCEEKDIIPPAEPVNSFLEHLWKHRDTNLVVSSRSHTYALSGTESAA